MIDGSVGRFHDLEEKGLRVLICVPLVQQDFFKPELGIQRRGIAIQDLDTFFGAIGVEWRVGIVLEIPQTFPLLCGFDGRGQCQCLLYRFAVDRESDRPRISRFVGPCAGTSF